LKVPEAGALSFIAYHPTQHVLQLFDVGVFGPLKKHWKSILQEYKIKTKAARVDKTTVPALLAKLWDVVAGFRQSGIHPLNS
jgi:hypothetical protein